MQDILRQCDGVVSTVWQLLRHYIAVTGTSSVSDVCIMSSWSCLYPQLYRPCRMLHAWLLLPRRVFTQKHQWGWCYLEHEVRHYTGCIPAWFKETARIQLPPMIGSYAFWDLTNQRDMIISNIAAQAQLSWCYMVVLSLFLINQLSSKPKVQLVEQDLCSGLHPLAF